MSYPTPGNAADVNFSVFINEFYKAHPKRQRLGSSLNTGACESRLLKNTGGFPKNTNNTRILG